LAEDIPEAAEELGGVAGAYRLDVEDGKG